MPLRSRDVVREAVTLPILFLTVVLVGSVRFGTPLQFVPPSLFALVLGMMLFGCLVQSGTLVPDALIHGERSSLENLNGLSVVITLFAASAQVITVVLPERGIPAVLMGTLLFALLAQAIAMSAPRERLLRGLAVSIGVAFLMRYVVLDALAAPAETRTARIVQLLFDGVTLGSVSQTPLHPATGYVAFAALVLYLFGLILLPRQQSHRWAEGELIGDKGGTEMARRDRAGYGGRRSG